MNTAAITTEQKTILLSKKGMKEMKKTITMLEHDRSNLIKSLHDLDRSSSHDERLERIERLAQLEAIEIELHEKKQILSRAKLIPTKSARMKVALGSVVDLLDQQGRLFRYTLVDTVEADPSDGRISVLSPLGKNLVGKTPKETVVWGRGQQMKLVNVR